MSPGRGNALAVALVVAAATIIARGVSPPISGTGGVTEAAKWLVRRKVSSVAGSGNALAVALVVRSVVAPEAVVACGVGAVPCRPGWFRSWELRIKG